MRGFNSHQSGKIAQCQHSFFIVSFDFLDSKNPRKFGDFEPCQYFYSAKMSGHDLIDDIHFSAILSGFFISPFFKAPMRYSFLYIV